MFTGLIEGIARVAALQRRAGAIRLALELGPLAEDARLGDSIAVNGVCLTLAELEGTTGSFDVIAETLQKTGLGELKVGDEVNCERSLKVGDRLGGHFVSGHVDAKGRIEISRQSQGQWDLRVQAPPALLGDLIPKGSVTIDGISLTVVDVDTRGFTVALIPETLERTTLGKKPVGATVNLEGDPIGKWVRRCLTGMLGEGGLTRDRLRELGF
ncbi:MAG: riboflavin synthase [Planctomycetota bacterium]